MWHVYFLELSNGDVYVGSTNDLRRRIVSHQQGHVISTRGLLPIVLRSYVANSAFCGRRTHRQADRLIEHGGAGHHLDRAAQWSQIAGDEPKQRRLNLGGSHRRRR
ncbi:GIY-YIG nuclease family protein [Bradyrhizobium ivorense]|uniref:GIY-YIG nuclease family protein n=1 Tax=Bradyrhizobium ivorense TaxID=2511166 RepID=UPI001FCF0F42|nr:GIY-YIG nuclease family protein [Bradyrhizobium ivorense]